MIKMGETVVCVESFSKVLKFYTEKLLFDIVMLETKNDRLYTARLKKGKYAIVFKQAPAKSSLEQVSGSECSKAPICLRLYVKKDIRKLHDRYTKKKVPSLSALEKCEDGSGMFFSVKDPEGIALKFIQADNEAAHVSRNDFLGMKIPEQSIRALPNSLNELVDDMSSHLKRFGVLRRSAKKYAKWYIKEIKKQGR